MDSVLSEIYKIRSQQGKERQKGMASYYDKLHNILLANNYKHPYKIKDKTIFEKESCYYENVTLPLCKDCGAFLTGTDYVYRIDNIDKFFGSKSRHDVRVEEQTQYKIDKDRYFENLIKNNTWQPISKLISNYKPYRGISWWTHNDLSYIDDGLEVAKAAHHCGILNDWLNKSCLLLRIKY